MSPEVSPSPVPLSGSLLVTLTRVHVAGPQPPSLVTVAVTSTSLWLAGQSAAGVTEIVAEVPMAEVLDYAPALRAITGGRGDYTLEFDRHEQVPAQLAEKVIAEARAGEQAA